MGFCGGAGVTINHRQRFESWLPALFDGEFDWDFLKPCFYDTKIMPMDFDAVVERRGHFLIFETKIDGKSISVGQSITLTEMWKKDTTIIQIMGKEPKEISAYQTYFESEKNKSVKVGSKELIAGDAFDVVYQVRRWFCWASGYEMPSRPDWDRQLWVIDYEGKAA